MKNSNHFLVIYVFLVAIIRITILCARGHPIQRTADSRSEVPSTNLSIYNNVESITNISGCEPAEYELQDVIFLQNNDLFLEAKNMTIHPSEYQEKDGKIFTCLPSVHEIGNRLILNCTEKFMYEKDDFYILPNKSVNVSGRLFREGEYALDHEKNILLICFEEYDDGGTFTDELSAAKLSITVSQAGSGISIIALIGNLFVFMFLPTLRNLPGYNLASLSVALLLAYSFLLIGQIPDVLGLFCVISGILQQYFFLASFFCMNVLAFDVWRTLKRATEKLIAGTRYSCNSQFMCYLFYSWGIPLIITSTSVIVENVEGAPSNIKPEYGKNNTCWIGNKISNAIFFTGPAFTLFIINAIFFIISARIIYSNTMKRSEDQNRQTVKLNYILYVRLALIMGLAWLVGLIALATDIEAIWFIFNLLNSLQGLFLFLLFTFNGKVFEQLVQKTTCMRRTSVKQATRRSRSSTFSSKIVTEI